VYVLATAEQQTNPASLLSLSSRIDVVFLSAQCALVPVLAQPPVDAILLSAAALHAKPLWFHERLGLHAAV
jgi:hypothetical protein